MNWFFVTAVVRGIAVVVIAAAVYVVAVGIREAILGGID